MKLKEHKNIRNGETARGQLNDLHEQLLKLNHKPNDKIKYIYN